jgi:hypothetical protein
MDADIFVPFTFFAFLTAIIIVPMLVKERTKRSAHDLVARAIDRGQTLDPALVQELSQNMLQDGDRARKSLGNAVIMLALAFAFVGIAYVSDGWDGGHDAHNGILVPAVLFGSLGLAFLLLAIIDYAAKKRAPA